MIVFKGKVVYEGIAIGTTNVMLNEGLEISNLQEFDSELETNRFNEARTKSMQELNDLYQESLKSVGAEEAEIFNIHKMMLEDLDFEDLVMVKLSLGYSAEYSVKEASNELSMMFKNMDDEYMKQRSQDVLDVASRVINNLIGNNKKFSLDCDTIILAKDIAPSEIVGFNKEHLKGIVTTFGSTSSHTAIIARSMSLPTIVDSGILLDKTFDKKKCIIDGFNGVIMIDPEDDVLSVYEEKLRVLNEENEKRKSLIGKDNVTLDGKRIDIFCNVGKSKDVKNTLEYDCGGIGLFRSEFLYLDSTDYPTEDFQFNEYKKTLEQMNGKTVIIRTMDIGADKQASYFNLPEEENPALGLRSLRICFERPFIMKTQLRALYRASIYGKLKIMVPMIISVEEVLWVKNMAKEVMEELESENIPFDKNVEIGIMIETPAAAIISDDLAKVADFFSIGSNDLTQYTLAIDRQNQALEKISNPKHKAILRLIKMVCDNAHKENKWVGICGELGRNMDLTEFFLKIGIDELSVSAPYVLKLREKVRSIDTTNVDINKYIG